MRNRLLAWAACQTSASGLPTNPSARTVSTMPQGRRGNMGDCRPVGGGVSEVRVDYGPGYRVYFGQKARGDLKSLTPQVISPPAVHTSAVKKSTAARTSVCERMKQLDIYDPAMCCSTGVCGPEVDPALVRFAANAKWLQDQGVKVRRFNLTQNPMAFVENEQVRQTLTEKGEAALPLLLLDGREIASGMYPDRARLAESVGLSHTEVSLFTPAVKERVAIGAAIAANCEPCLRYHVRVARELGVSLADVAHAINLAAKVKELPHQAVLKLGARLTMQDARDPETAGSEGSSASSAAPNV